MTDIDVSGCKNYSFKEFINFTECPDYCADYLDGICSNHPDCYYKQLKRLEQENQELGKIIDCKNGTIASLAKVRDELKEENKKLKEALEEIREMVIYDCVRECSNNSENCTIGSCLEKRIQRKIKAYLTNTCLICGQNNTSKCVDCGCTKVNEIIEGAEDEN